MLQAGYGDLAHYPLEASDVAQFLLPGTFEEKDEHVERLVSSARALPPPGCPLSSRRSVTAEWTLSGRGLRLKALENDHD